VVGVVAAAALPRLEAELAARHGELTEVDCARGPGRTVQRAAVGPDTGPVTWRALVVDAGERSLLLEGFLPDRAAAASIAEFDAAFAAACAVP
jgi:hypothetical protein